MPQSRSLSEFLGKELSDGRILVQFGYIITDNKTYKGNGTVLMQGGCFKFSCGPIVVYNNGQTMWSVDSNAKEVVIQNGVVIDGNVSDTKMMGLFGVMASRDSVNPIKGPDGKLLGLSCSLKSGGQVDVRINGIVHKPQASVGDFSFRTDNLGPSWVVTDLR